MSTSRLPTHTGCPAEQAAFVRPYLVTRGRTRHRHLLSPDTVLEAGTGRAGPGLSDPEYDRIARLCQERRRSVAELAGTIELPLTATRVLIGDLVDARVLVLSLTTAYTDSESSAEDGPSRQLLEALRAGLALRWPDAVSKARAS
ncbi:DUF742 domain-containing protein [Streptomyces griseoviridis]|uniref:DUF742 domain-containing protein n=1 Tax=Streptomyces griseoviridis TaxID=45398 RepID=A0A3S9ZHT0_STRGD|nr:DUF742 domain-containing protein [Streptomyces griseoviridis]AZS87249.1 DUF742 domain-containing protein [Streptomyces griseoviridis]QCN85898.1 DUF742 domain-containing protein [Streptomyces griseoviridis]